MRIQKFSFESFGHEQPLKPRAAGSSAQAEIVAAEAPPVETAAEESPPPPLPTFSEEDIVHARAEGEKAGYARAQQEAQAATKQEEARLSEVMTSLGAKLDTLRERIVAENAERQQETAALAFAIAQKIAGRALENNALAEIEATLEKCLQFLFDQPKIKIYVPEKQLEAVKEKLDAIRAASQFPGEIKVKPDAELTHADCRVQWEEGALVHRHQDVVASLEKTLSLPPSATDEEPGSYKELLEKFTPKPE